MPTGSTGQPPSPWCFRRRPGRGAPAGTTLGRHLLEDGVMYASSEPCPMCLIACYWARLPRVVYAATSHDVATYGFEDLQFYREIALPSDQRSIREDAADGELREAAA